MKKGLLLLLLVSPLYAEGPRYRHQDKTTNLEFQNVYQDLREVKVTSTTLPSGSTNYIQNRTTAQSGASFNIDGNGVVGGVMSASNGSQSSPSFAFQNDSGMDTGMYLSGTNALGFSNGGGSRMIQSGTSVEWYGPNHAYSYIHRTTSTNEGLLIFTSSNATQVALGLDNDGTDNMNFFVAGNLGTPRMKLTNTASGTLLVGSSARTEVSQRADGDSTIGGASGSNVVYFHVNGAEVAALTSTNLLPVGAGTVSTGNASRYWNDVSFKTLSDRGCLGWFDEGVEMRDGKIVNDLGVFREIKMHPTKKTIYGAPMLDYRTFPKVSYKKADYEVFNSTLNAYENKILPRDEQDEPYYYEVNISTTDIVSNKIFYSEEDIPKEFKDRAIKKLAADGIEMTSIFSIMFGALKEANERIESLEAKVSDLEKR